MERNNKRPKVQKETPRINEFGQPIGRALPDFKTLDSSLLAVKSGMDGRYCRLELFNLEEHTRPLFDAFVLDDGSMWSYLTFGPFETVEVLRKKLQEITSKYLAYTVISVETKTPVGFLTYLNIQPEHGSLEIGAVVFSPLLRRSCASTEAVYLLIKHCFELGWRRCEWKCDSLNAPSNNAAQRLGFQFEGTFRQSWVLKGRNRDTNWYSIIDQEYPSVRTRLETWLSPDNFDSQGQQIQRLSEIGF